MGCFNICAQNLEEEYWSRSLVCLIHEKKEKKLMSQCDLKFN
jgi:hypothetical protein